VRRERAEVGDPAVRDDQLRAGVALHESVQVVGDGREAAAAVDEDRDSALGRQLEHGREALVVQQEALRPRVELDPARAEVEAARRLLDRLLGEVEAHERDQAAARACGVLERPVVRRAEGRVPVDLVHAEHETARDPVAVVDPLEVVVDPVHPVDVVTEVDVGVEDLGAFGQLAPELLVVTGDQGLGPLEDVFHCA
jgi:hypothetical protein